MKEHTEHEKPSALNMADQWLVDRLRGPAETAATQTFGPFNDSPDSPFYSAEGRSPMQTWEKIAERVVLATTVAIIHGTARREIDTHAIQRLHEIIFQTTFPQHAGRLRQRGEEARYGIVLGTIEQPIIKGERATAGARLQPRLQQICDEFNAAAATQDQLDAIQLDERLHVAIRLYAKVLSAHPFLDGNGRTVFTLLQYGLARSGLPCVALEDFDAHQHALGTALRTDGKQSYDSLQALIAAKLIKVETIDNDH